jgi:hypothetical protein
MAKNDMVEDQTEEKPKKQRRNTGPRPLHVLYRGDDVEIVEFTRDANTVIDMIQNDPTLKHKKVEGKVGR